MPPIDPERKAVIVHVITLVVLSLFLFFWRIGDHNFLGTEGHRALPAQTMLDTHERELLRSNGRYFSQSRP